MRKLRIHLRNRQKNVFYSGGGQVKHYACNESWVGWDGNNCTTYQNNNWCRPGGWNGSPYRPGLKMMFGKIDGWLSDEGAPVLVCPQCGCVESKGINFKSGEFQSIMILYESGRVAE